MAIETGAAGDTVGFDRWAINESVRLLVVYAALIAAIYPAFYFFTRWIPENQNDSLGLRIASAALSAVCALAVLLIPRVRPWAPRLQFLSIGFFFLTLFAILVATRFNVWYVCGDLVGVFGAQYAFVRRRGLVMAYGIGVFALVALAAAGGLFENGLALYAIAVIFSGSVISVVLGWFRIVTLRVQVASVVSLQRQAVELREQAERIHHLAYFDSLTGLPNRTSMNELIERALADRRADGRSGAMLYLDLDGFKEINDAFGHDTGDRVLSQAALRLRGILRSDDAAARLGGDEFAVLLPLVDKRETADKLAQRIQSSFADTFLLDGRAFTLSSSIGIAHFPADASTRDELLNRADAAMYSAKRRGRGCVFAYAQPGA